MNIATKLAMRSTQRSRLQSAGLVLLAILIAGCSSPPPTPAWQMDARSAMDRSVSAYLQGDSRVAQAEMVNARRALSSTGRPDLLAQAELLFCAAHVASLDFAPCTGFESLRADATPTQRAYADYLYGKASSPHQADANADQALTQLVQAAVQLQTGKATPEMIAQATDTASRQGWRRPLLAWLGAQAMRAEQSGNTAAAKQLWRRMALVQGGSN